MNQAGDRQPLALAQIHGGGHRATVKSGNPVDRIVRVDGRDRGRDTEPNSVLVDNCWCEGEIVIDEGKNFNEFQNWRRYPDRLRFYVFHIFKGELPKCDFIVKEERHDNGLALFKYSKDRGYEGIVAKLRNYVYEFGTRSNQWIKFKCVKQKIITVTDYEVNKTGITFSSPIRVSVNGEKHKEVLAKFKERGQLDILVEYLEELPSGKLRQPIYKKVIE